jgi:hypothetical protein
MPDFECRVCGTSFNILEPGDEFCPNCGTAYPKTAIIRKVIVTQSREARLQLAVAAGRQAFWGAVAQAYPEITTGDFSPEATLAWERATEDAVRSWRDGNE